MKSGSTALVRIDLNTAIVNKKIVVNSRFLKHAETIEFLRKKYRVVLLAHQGRRGDKDFTDLKMHARLLSNILGFKVRYIDGIYDSGVLDIIKKLNVGDVLLLKNVRSMKYECSNIDFSKTSFVRKLSSVCDFFVLDAFSVAHRSHASVVGFRKSLPCFAGPLLLKEVKKLTLLNNPLRPFVIVLGGAKVEECFDIMLHVKADIFLCGGLFGELLSYFNGVNFGFKNSKLSKFGKYKTFIKRIDFSRVVLPNDFVLSNKDIVTVGYLPVSIETRDIGPSTVNAFIESISHAKTVLFKGPLGVFEEGFMDSSKRILTAIRGRAVSVIGGGDSSAVFEILQFKEADFSLVSTGGGALIEFLSGKELPGLSVLNFYKGEMRSII